MALKTKRGIRFVRQNCVKDWKEFLELLDFRGVDLADLAALEA